MNYYRVAQSGAVILFLALTGRFANAQANAAPILENGASDATSSEIRTVLVRGQPSNIVGINMGPKATAYWNLIQNYVKTGDLESFSNVAKALRLLTKNSSNAASIAEQGTQRIDEIFSTDGFVRGGNYFIYRYGPESPNRTGVSLNLTLDISFICIPEPEVWRVFGRGLYTPVSDKTYEPGEREDETGIEHHLGSFGKFGKLSFGFAFAASGCARNFGAAQEFFTAN